MLRIMALEQSGRATLRLEGRVVGPWVEELRRSCERALEAGTPLTLDVGELVFVEREGARLLSRLVDRGVELVNCPAFVHEQLKALPSC